MAVSLSSGGLCPGQAEATGFKYSILIWDITIPLFATASRERCDFFKGKSFKWLDHLLEISREGHLFSQGNCSINLC